ncbi:hypothetical protein CHR55_27255 [Rhodococcus qingshengii]|uniref:DUF2510 domain-containing protein n=2 Tax=Rhodococcus qingshengii TaxID=334542 RepID=A0A2A5J4M7_RHOSG|nr:hypothetical protein CHR55_27255 [Rhodococcus qingshengii]
MAPTSAETGGQHNSSPAPQQPADTASNSVSDHHNAPEAANPVPVAGWYPDQTDPGRVRWFDGKQWTDATLPNSAPPQM